MNFCASVNNCEEQNVSVLSVCVWDHEKRLPLNKTSVKYDLKTHSIEFSYFYNIRGSK